MARRKKRKSRRKKARRRTVSRSNLGRTLVELTGLERGRVRLPASQGSRVVAPDLFGLGRRKRRKSSKKRRRKSVARRPSMRSLSRRRKSNKRRNRMKGLARRGGMRRVTGLGSLGAAAATVSRAAKGRPFVGAYNWVFSKYGIQAAAGVVGGSAVGTLSASLIQKYILTGRASNDLMTNLIGDFVGAALAWELGKQVDNNVAAFAAIASATRSINSIVGNQVGSLLGAVGVDHVATAPTALAGMGAWHEYDYEGGGVGQIHTSDYTPLGETDEYGYEQLYGLGKEQWPETEPLHGLDAEEATLFG